MGLKHQGKFMGFGKKKEVVKNDNLQKEERVEIEVLEEPVKEETNEMNERPEEEERAEEPLEAEKIEEEGSTEIPPIEEIVSEEVVEKDTVKGLKKFSEEEIVEEQLEESFEEREQERREDTAKGNVVRIHREPVTHKRDIFNAREERRPGQPSIEIANVEVVETIKADIKRVEEKSSNNRFMDMLSLAVKVSDYENEKEFIENAINNRIENMLKEGTFTFKPSIECKSYYVGTMGEATVKAKGQMVLEQCARIDGCKTVAEFIENAVREMVKVELLNVIDTNIIYSSKIYETV